MTSSAPAASKLRFPPAKFSIAAAILVVAAGYLIWSGTQAAAVYYFTVAEVSAQREAVMGKAIRVQGTVQDGSIEQDATKLWIKFRLTDGVRSIPVIYDRTPPDLLGYSNEDKYQDVVVEGRLQADGTLEARNLLVKHGPEFEPVDKLPRRA